MSDTVNVGSGVELVRGPQDGARVTSGSGWMPTTIFVGRTWMGDGFTAWGRAYSERFPLKYDYDGVNFFCAGEDP